jgi:pimeloyl-ACP methyl ester carboxylesterase
MSDTFVLIHGSRHGGWAWEGVVRHLSEKGHRAHTPTRPGHGRGALRQGITHQDCVSEVVAFVQRHGLEDLILVGHSFEGSVVQKVAEQLPDRIRRTVFLDALILEDNDCVFDNLPAAYASYSTLWPKRARIIQCWFLGNLAQQLHPGRIGVRGTVLLGATVPRA